MQLLLLWLRGKRTLFLRAEFVLPPILPSPLLLLFGLTDLLDPLVLVLVLLQVFVDVLVFVFRFSFFSFASGYLAE